MYRYPQSYVISSPLDPMRDTLVLLEYLTAKDYLVSTLTSVHALSKSAANARAERIMPHIRTAIAFIEQSLATPTELCFLPAYYGILNLMKTYILLGPHHAELSSQRWHGATYPVEEKDSRNLLTEHVMLKNRGAIPLFYRTVTGRPIHSTRITMGQIYPYVSNITAEYFLATGNRSKIAAFKIDTIPYQPTGKKILMLQYLRQQGDVSQHSIRDFKGLRTFKQDQSKRDLFIGRPFPKTLSVRDKSYRNQFRPFLLYGFKKDIVNMASCSKRLLLPEELPIALLFFHMSNVVRYKPEFLYRIRASRFWPMLAAARQHCLLRMLMLTWSYIHQKELVLEHHH